MTEETTVEQGTIETCLFDLADDIDQNGDEISLDDGSTCRKEGQHDVVLGTKDGNFFVE